VFLGEGIAQVSADTRQNHLAGKWRPLNGSVRVIGMDFYPTRPHHQRRNGTTSSAHIYWTCLLGFYRTRLRLARIV